MENYDYRLNKDHVTERNIIVSLLGVLEDKISISNFRKNVEERVEVPFYYSMSGDERFMYDKFMKPLFDNDEKAASHYDKVPRGVISYQSTNIIAANKTNPHVYGKLPKLEKNGTIKTFFAKYKPIPIVMNFNCRILVSPSLDLFKISEQIKIMLYKNTLFYTDVNMVKVPGILTMPEDLDRQRPIEFTFTDKKELVIEFAFDVLSYIPNFDKTSTKFAGNRMQAGIFHGIYIKPDLVKNDPLNPSLDENGNVIGNTPTTGSGKIAITTPDDGRKVLNIPRDTDYYRE